MVQLKVILDTRRKKADGTYPILFRVTNIKKVNYLSSGLSIMQEDWDELTHSILKTHPNHKPLNLSLSKKYYEIQRGILRLENDNLFSIEGLKSILYPKPTESVKPLTFNEYTKKLIKQMMVLNKTGNALVYKHASNRFINFVGSKTIEFTQIDYNLLDSFRHQLIMEGMKINSISNYFRTIRAIYNRAVKAKLVEKSHYPFQDITIKTERTAKRAIMMSDIVTIANLSLDNHLKKWNARNYFLLSLSLIGISFTDLAYLKSSNIKDGRLEYKRRKTHKDYSIKLTPICVQLFETYKNPENTYLLPIIPTGSEEDSLVCKSLISQWIKNTNKWLKAIGLECNIKDNITTYVARHTWATTAKRLGFSNEVIAEAMGHEFGNRITNIYLDSFDQHVIDELNEKVLAPITLTISQS